MKLNQITEFLSEHVLAVCAGFIALTIGLDLCLLGNPWPGLSEPWVSDIAYNFSWHMNGKMAQDIPYGQTWSTGLGKLFFLLHKVTYSLIGVGTFQARLVTYLGLLFIAGLMVQVSFKAFMDAD